MHPGIVSMPIMDVLSDIVGPIACLPGIRVAESRIKRWIKCVIGHGLDTKYLLLLFFVPYQTLIWCRISPKCCQTPSYFSCKHGPGGKAIYNVKWHGLLPHCPVDRVTWEVLASTHWGQDKTAAVSQTTLSNAFSWMKILEFRLRFHWRLFLRVQLTIFHHWFR